MVNRYRKDDLPVLAVTAVIPISICDQLYIRDVLKNSEAQRERCLQYTATVLGTLSQQPKADIPSDWRLIYTVTSISLLVLSLSMQSWWGWSENRAQTHGVTIAFGELRLLSCEGPLRTELFSHRQWYALPGWLLGRCLHWKSRNR